MISSVHPLSNPPGRPVAAELGGEGEIAPPIIRMEGHGGAWRGMDGHGGAWRGMEGHGGAWMGMDGAWLPKFNKYLRSTTGSTLVSESTLQLECF